MRFSDSRLSCRCRPHGTSRLSPLVMLASVYSCLFVRVNDHEKELEKDRRFLFENEGKQRNELECLKREKDQQLSSLKLRLTECEGKSRELEEKLCTMETDLRRSQRLAAQCREELETATRRHQQDVKAIQDTLAAKQEIINDQRHKITSLEQALDQPPKQSETEALPSPFLSSVVTANGESLLEKIHRLEVHNRKLQFDNSIFREASAAQRIIEEKLFAAEQRLVQFQQLEAENARLQSQLQSETDHERPRSPSTVAETIIQHHDTRSIRDLLERTMTLAKLEASIGEMKARNAGLEAEVTDTRQQLEATKQQLQDRTAELDSVNVALLQTRQQQTLLRTEVSNVKEQLEAAEKMEQASHSIIQNLSKKLA